MEEMSVTDTPTGVEVFDITNKLPALLGRARPERVETRSAVVVGNPNPRKAAESMDTQAPLFLPGCEPAGALGQSNSKRFKRSCAAPAYPTSILDIGVAIELGTKSNAIPSPLEPTHKGNPGPGCPSPALRSVSSSRPR